MKDSVPSLGANVAERSIVQCGKSLGGIASVTRQFDEELGIKHDIGTHSEAQLGTDKAIVTRELCLESRVFDYIPGRQHKTFAGLKPNIADCIHKSKLILYFTRRK